MLVQAIFPFPTMFSTLSKTEMIIFVTYNLSSANAFNLVRSKILSCGNGLKGSERREKKRNCSLRAISAFPREFSKDSTADTLKQGLFGKYLTQYRLLNLILDDTFKPCQNQNIRSYLPLNLEKLFKLTLFTF